MSFLITALGLLGMAIMTLGFACKSDARVRVLNIFGISVWIAHFSLLGAWSVSSMMTLGLLMLLARSAGYQKLANGLLLLTALLLFPALYAWLSGHAGIDMVLSVLVTLGINGGLVLFSGHAMTASIAAGVGLNALVSILVGSWPGAATNLINLAALAIRALRQARTQPTGDVHIPDACERSA